jgi:hypothetical protein
VLQRAPERGKYGVVSVWVVAIQDEATTKPRRRWRRGGARLPAGSLVGTVRVEPKVANNLGVAAVSALLLVVLASHVFLENFAPRF